LLEIRVDEMLNVVIGLVHPRRSLFVIDGDHLIDEFIEAILRRFGVFAAEKAIDDRHMGKIRRVEFID
jgi:hypothetical protein